MAAVDANKPHAAIFENVYSFWALMGPEFDKLMAATGSCGFSSGRAASTTGVSPCASAAALHFLRFSYTARADSSDE